MSVRTKSSHHSFSSLLLQRGKPLSLTQLMSTSALATPATTAEESRLPALTPPSATSFLPAERSYGAAPSAPHPTQTESVREAARAAESAWDRVVGFDMTVILLTLRELQQKADGETSKTLGPFIETVEEKINEFGLLSTAMLHLVDTLEELVPPQSGAASMNTPTGQAEVPTPFSSYSPV